MKDKRLHAQLWIRQQKTVGKSGIAEAWERNIFQQEKKWKGEKAPAALIFSLPLLARTLSPSLPLHSSLSLEVRHNIGWRDNLALLDNAISSFWRGESFLRKILPVSISTLSLALGLLLGRRRIIFSCNSSRQLQSSWHAWTFPTANQCVSLHWLEITALAFDSAVHGQMGQVQSIIYSSSVRLFHSIYWIWYWNGLSRFRNCNISAKMKMNSVYESVFCHFKKIHAEWRHFSIFFIPSY